MSSRNLAKPIFPLAPEQYSRQYMDALVQSFSVYLEQYQNPGEGRATKTVMTDIPTTPVDLEDGTVWVDSTILRVGTGGTPGTFVVPNLEVTTNLTVSTGGTADIDGTLNANGTLNVNNTFNIDAVEVTATATELNYNDVTTLGTVEANKTVTAGAAKAIDFADAPMTNVDINSGAIDGTPIGFSSASTGGFTDLGVTGTATVDTANITYGTIALANITSIFQLSGTAVTATATELNYNDIGSLGQVQANKVVTADSFGIDFNNFDLTNVDINSGTIDAVSIGTTSAGTGNFSTLSIAGTAITASAAELNYNDISSLGSVESNKTVTANASGNVNFNGGDIVDVNIGTSSPGTGSFTVLDADERLILPSYSTTGRDAISSPEAGLLIFNSTTGKLNFYTGSAWEAVSSA